MLEGRTISPPCYKIKDEQEAKLKKIQHEESDSDPEVTNILKRRVELKGSYPRFEVEHCDKTNLIYCI